MRASKAMQERVLTNPKIEVIYHTVLLEALGDPITQKLRALKVKNTAENREYEIEVGGLFYAIGHVPNTAFLGGQLALDDTLYVLTKPGTTQTSVEGVFAAGDVQDKIYRQAVTAAGSGCMAALEAERWLSEHKFEDH